jgi:hypothetical protein
VNKADNPFAEVMSLWGDRASAARLRMSDLSSDLMSELEHRPFRTLALAAGAGYLLGGGLFSRLTLRAVSLGARVAIVATIASDLAAVDVAPPRLIEGATSRPRRRSVRNVLATET